LRGVSVEDIRNIDMEVEDKKKRPSRIQWDEETIAEHDKERGTRQKVDEFPSSLTSRCPRIATSIHN
jgi:hypothetical protein